MSFGAPGWRCQEGTQPVFQGEKELSTEKAGLSVSLQDGYGTVEMGGTAVHLCASQVTP